MNYRNILIVKLSAIGDVIHALPVAAALKQQFPEARITWVVEKPAYDILTNNPNIDEIIVFDKTNFKTVAGLVQHVPPFIKMLREYRFDLALDLQGLFKSAAIVYLSGAANRFVYCNAREFSHLLSQPICGANQNGHVVERYLDVARALGCQINKIDFTISITDKEGAQATAKAAQAGLDINKPYVVLIPGANWPNKCWPTAHFVQLANMLYDVGMIPVIIGSSADTIRAQEIIAKASIPPIDITGKTSLKELAYILKHAKIVVAGDTGTMHLAAAVKTPVVALFGPTDPRRNGPFGTANIVLQAGHTCDGCWQRRCPKDIQCLKVIEPKNVFAALNTLLLKADEL